MSSPVPTSPIALSASSRSADSAHESGATAKRTLPVIALSTLVVGTMVGAGVYSLPADFAASTGVVGALIAWIVSGLGTLMLALVFQRLAVTRPDLDAGIFAYAKAGFGDYVGFFSAFGYWASAIAGNGTYVVLIGSTLGQVFPILGEGNTPASALLSTAILWAFHFLIVRGVRQAALINTVVTIAKIVPIVVFIVLVALVGVNWHTFSANLWVGAGDASSLGALFGQVRSSMLVAVFVFLGVEGASVYSRYARKRRDVGRATMLGFGSVLLILMLVTLVAYAALPVATLAGEHQPSMAGVLAAVVGPWGAVFVSIGLLVSVLGAFLAWTLMAAEVFFNAARAGDAPAIFARVNRAGVPSSALLLTTLAVQLLIVVSLFSSDAFQFCLMLCAALAVVPYVLTAGFALRESIVGRRSGQASGRSSIGPIAVAALALVYTLFLVYATGVTYLLISAIVYAPASLLFAAARRRSGRRIFRPWEAALAAFTVAAAIAGLIALAAGWISI
ncbi:basic amino acid/polyamine antiporter [Gryllotalpicola daejeonensis]|uniref:Basic amino acid/polyamine antiporter n=1 Tax=Gryllotalpicola daejeonensis TaxID=993087 RepID=A0ABP7ZNZ3_9MICO